MTMNDVNYFTVGRIWCTDRVTGVSCQTITHAATLNLYTIMDKEAYVPKMMRESITMCLVRPQPTHIFPMRLMNSRSEGCQHFWTNQLCKFCCPSGTDRKFCHDQPHMQRVHKLTLVGKHLRERECVCFN